MDFLKEAESIRAEITGYRRWIHKNPEIGMDTFKTADFVEKVLNDLGIRTSRPIPSAVVGLLEGSARGNKEVKTAALRADMDALPIDEKTGLDYASEKEGRMHACGHDAHTAILLGTALIMSKNRNTLNGNVKFLFQPAEETSGGALPMIEAGVLSNPEVSAIFGLHCNTGLEAGEIAVKYGQVYAASDTFIIDVKGLMSHGAAPHMGVDAIIVSSHIVTALNQIVSREISPANSAVVTIGTVHGGNARNVLAEDVRMTGITRATDPEDLIILRQKIRRTAEGVAAGFGADAIVQFEAGYTALINDRKMTDLVKTSGEKILGRDAVSIHDCPNMGVEDMAYFLKEVPGCFFYLGVANKKQGITAPLHNNRFNIDEDALIYGTAVQCENLFSFLS